MRVGSGILALLACLLTAGCVVHAHPPLVMTPRGDILHEHGLACGHFYAEGRWMALAPNHVHGPFCGHVRMGTVWHVKAVMR
ncbi:MAG TPA: hypothetical protein VFI25_02890 [Planctomycetota bacterium]|jgi:hypothetical protein|nr:hypothetical protein [Planctomycetota bacterium]